MMTYVADFLAHSEHRRVCPQRPPLLISRLPALPSRGRRIRMLIQGAPRQCLDMEMRVPTGPAD